MQECTHVMCTKGRTADNAKEELLMVAERNEKSFFDKDSLKEGDDFTITCDADSVLVPHEFQNISLITIAKHMTSNPFQVMVFAEYKKYSESPYHRYIPLGRNWIIKFSDKNTTNNRSMRITMHVLKSHHLDTGVYLCSVQYINRMGKTVEVSKSRMLRVDDIADTTYVTEDEMFTTTCDADHALVLSNCSDIMSVHILKTVMTNVPQNFTNIATYISSDRKIEQHIPDTRNWLIIFNGAGTGKNNRNMKIDLEVYDSKCADTGMYYCNVSYTDSKTTASKIQRVLNIVVEARATKRIFRWEMSLSDQLGHQELSSYYTLTIACAFDGPSKNATVLWKIGTLMASTNTYIYNDYLHQGNTTAVNLPSQVGSTCQRKHYKSTLEIIVNQFEHKHSMFACFLQHRDRDTEIGKMIPDFTDTQFGKAIKTSANGSQKRQLSRKLFLLCLGSAVMMLQLRTDGEL